LATNHRDDFALLASLGHTKVRIGLEWARLEPEPGRIDADAFDLYQDILGSAADVGLEPIATLHHGTLPGWFSEDTLGFRDEHSRNYFWARHVDRCAERFDGLVKCWVPIDDPVGWAIRGFMLGSRPPGLKDPETTAEAIEGALRANHVAWELLKSGDTPVMAVFGVPTIFGQGEDNDAHRRLWHDLFFTTWMSLIRDGELLIPGLTPRELPELAGSFDIIGLSHDHPVAVDRTGALRPYPANGRRSDNGFTPVPNELAELLAFMSSELPNRDLMIASNGVATTDDEWREQLLGETLRVVRSAREDGVRILGYLHDTGIDGYEGPLGFATQRGIITRSRDLKDSARLFLTV